MLFRIVMVCLFVAETYALYQIWAIHDFYRSLETPEASFTTIEQEGNQNPLTIVEFMHYTCLYCKDSHAVLVDYARTNPEIRLVTRPIPFEGNSEQAALYALAAGLQGKFWEMDSALTEYRGPVDEKFYRESAALYNIDYDRMVEDSKTETVRALAKDNVAAFYAMDVQSTPAFIIGRTLYQPDKALTLNDLVRMVQNEKNN